MKKDERKPKQQLIKELAEMRQRIAELEASEAERVRAEEIQLLADVVRNMQVGLHLYHLEDIDDDRTLRMVATNLAASQFTGVAMEDVLGKTLDENFPGLREKGIPQLYAEVVRSGKSVELEEVYYGDDRVMHGAFSVEAFPLPNNHVGVTFENITERKRMEETLHKSEEKYHSLYSSMTEGVALHEIL
jgi:PAS domain-containing protein